MLSYTTMVQNNEECQRGQKRKYIYPYSNDHDDVVDVDNDDSENDYYPPRQKEEQVCRIVSRRKNIYEFSSSSSQCPSQNIIPTLQQPWRHGSYEHHQQHQAQQQELSNKCYFDDLPPELFFKVISYIGPASTTLITLTHVNKSFATLMNQVGEAMLHRAKSTYHMLLPKLHYDEPLLSLCTRHVRCFQDIMYKCHTIKNILDKAFVQGCLDVALTRGYISPESVNDLNEKLMKREIDKKSSMTQHNVNRTIDNSSSFTSSQIISSSSSSSSSNIKAKEPITISDIDHALDLALDILGCDNISYFVENNKNNIPLDIIHPFNKEGRQNILEYFTENIEHQILSLCGKCGGKVFKFIKTITLLKHQQPMYQPQQQGLLSRSSFIHQWKDEERLDRARLLMQLVIHRFMNLDRTVVHSDDLQDVHSSSDTALPPTNNNSISNHHDLGDVADDHPIDSNDDVGEIVMEQSDSYNENTDPMREEDVVKEEKENEQSLYSWLEE